jgi:hypothetical protein
VHPTSGGWRLSLAIAILVAAAIAAAGWCLIWLLALSD